MMGRRLVPRSKVIRKNAVTRDDEDSPAARRRGRLRTAAEIATILALVVGVFAWLLPRDPNPDERRTDDAGPARPPSAAPRQEPGTTPDTPKPALLNRIVPERGRQNLMSLPRALTEQPEYADPVVLTCPSNQTGDTSREVTWTLSGRFLRFEATAHAYYDPPTMFLVDVVQVVGTLQRDHTIATVEAGRQRLSEADSGATVDISVEGAQELTVRVACQKVGGVVVLANARLTPAS